MVFAQNWEYSLIFREDIFCNKNIQFWKSLDDLGLKVKVAYDLEMSNLNFSMDCSTIAKFDT